MQIECTTIRAAAQVLFVLVDAHLRPGGEFHITGPRPPEPPIRFTLSGNLPAHVVRQLQGIPDARIAGEHAA
jgi:hypothetical protein